MKQLPLLLLMTLALTAHARLGENQAELEARLGAVRSKSSHSMSAQGQRVVLGPTLNFEKDDWSIQCLMMGERCAMVIYTKGQKRRFRMLDVWNGTNRTDRTNM